jgi:hypothetical protein
MRRLLAIFVLTRPEQRLVIFVILALVLGASIKHYRERRIDERPRLNPEVSQLASPTPNER